MSSNGGFLFPGGQGAHHKGGAVGLAVVDHAEQDAIILLHSACWARHKDELLAETAPARAPALQFAGLCVEAHKHLRAGQGIIGVTLTGLFTPCPYK